MSERNKHLFQFSAAQIAEAAKTEAIYHNERLIFWTKELNDSKEIVVKTASVKVVLAEVTGGWRPDVVVDYGDRLAYNRMQEAATKIQEHDKAWHRLMIDSQLYDTQGSRVYELDAEDVSHYRLNGRDRTL